MTISLEVFLHLYMLPAGIFCVLYPPHIAHQHHMTRLRAVIYSIYMIVLGFVGTYGAGSVMSFFRERRGLEGNVRLAIFGAIYAVFIATLITVPVENGVRALLRRFGKNVPSVSLLDTWDVLEPGAFMFILFTKVRCLAAGCCYGIPCSWGIYNWVAKEKTFPVQIFEILMTATILLVVYHLKRKPFFRRGMAMFLAAIAYCCGRFFLEYLKYYVPEDRTYLGRFTFWQVALIIVIIICASILLFLYKTRPADPLPERVPYKWEARIRKRLRKIFPKKAAPKKHHGGEWQSTKKKYKKKKK